MFFDPDRDWKSPDKKRHLVLFFVVAALLDIPWPVLEAAVIAWLCGVFLELGQWDTARNPDLALLDQFGDSEGSPLGRPGFGFGLLDIAANTAGILAYVGVSTIVRAIV